MEARLIWLFEYINPYLQIADATVLVLCGAYCMFSFHKHRTSGVFLIALCCITGSIQTVLFFVSAFQDGQPFLPLSFEIRRTAYLYARLLGPLQAVLFATTVVVIARQNLRHTTT
jgi:hypothetical protein